MLAELKASKQNKISKTNMATARPLSMNPDYDELQTVLLVGNKRVGKTSIIRRFTEGSRYKADAVVRPTVGIDFQMTYFHRGQKRILLQIFDASGEGKYQDLIRQFYIKAMGVILLYDITDSSSFESLGRWIDEIRKYTYYNTQIIIAGHKCDSSEGRVISYADVAQYAADLRLPYIEVSAHNNYNVNQLFEFVTDRIDYAMRLTVENRFR